MKTLPIEVFRSSYGDCTNGGISSKFGTLYLISDEGWYDVDEDDPRLVKLVKRHLFGKDYFHVEPVKHGSGVGPMYGGNIAYCSDSRFPTEYPLKIHDRFESQEQYDCLSH